MINLFSLPIYYYPLIGFCGACLFFMMFKLYKYALFLIKFGISGGIV